MIIVESSNVLICPLHAPLYNFSVIRITNIWMQQQSKFFKIPGFGSWKKPGFRVVKNSQKKRVSGSGKPRLETLVLTACVIVQVSSDIHISKKSFVLWASSVFYWNKNFTHTNTVIHLDFRQIWLATLTECTDFKKQQSCFASVGLCLWNNAVSFIDFEHYAAAV